MYEVRMYNEQTGAYCGTVARMSDAAECKALAVRLTADMHGNGIVYLACKAK